MNSKFNNFTETELAQEQWRDIAGYDGVYQVSDLGRVRSRKSGEWKVLKGGKGSNGYFCVTLCKNGNGKCSLIHRLVASTFIPNNDESKTVINHKNEIKTDNRASNLEWCTVLYNNTYNDLQSRKKNSKYPKIKDLYDPNLSIKQNLEIFKANGIECSKIVIKRLRRDLNLKDRSNYKQNEIRPLYRPDLSITENLELFKSNGIECSRETVRRFRKELELIK